MRRIVLDSPCKFFGLIGVGHQACRIHVERLLWLQSPVRLPAVVVLLCGNPVTGLPMLSAYNICAVCLKIHKIYEIHLPKYRNPPTKNEIHCLKSVDMHLFQCKTVLMASYTKEHQNCGLLSMNGQLLRSVPVC